MVIRPLVIAKNVSVASRMKKIEAYLDCVSPFSYHAFTYLLSNRAHLAQHNVEVEFIPVFLGGIMAGSGNAPPWKLNAKAVHSDYESERAQKYFRKIGGRYYGDNNGTGQKLWVTPSFFPIMSVLPQRILTHIKQAYPQHVYEQTFLSFFHHLWSAEPQLDISKPDNVAIAMQEIYLENDGGRKPVFAAEEIQSIIQASSSDAIKDKLKRTTEYCWKDLGAFGCPWFWVISDEATTARTSSPGRWRKPPGQGRAGEPFFGSDRWHFMWEYLDIPWEDVKILPPGGKGGNRGTPAKL